MKAAVFYGEHDIRTEDLPMPVAGPGQVLVEVHACGICGTDVHIFHGDEGAAKTPAGTVLGHEFAGKVVAVGEGVKNVKPGDKVVIGKFTGTEIKLDGVDYKFIKQDDILAVVTD